MNRLSVGANESGKQVVFVVGAPLTAPKSPDELGVADVIGVISLIRETFRADPAQLHVLDREIATATNAYDAAFLFLQGRRGQDAANLIVRSAVIGALQHNRKQTIDIRRAVSADLDRQEERTDDWELGPAVTALGSLATLKGGPFSKSIITSNFDPLIEIAIRRAGGRPWRTVLHTDGDLAQSSAEGCQVIHIHGYWHGSDTLHVSHQLLQSRPSLTNSLLSFLREKTLVVMAYGGWEDVLTRALGALTSDQSAYPEIIWTFYDDVPKLSPHLLETLGPGIDRSRVTLYSGIDCNIALPQLATIWKTLRPSSGAPVAISHERSLNSLGQQTRTSSALRIDRKKKVESDRAPSIDFWVGREPELRSLETSRASVIVISGIGGQGKSALAARYIQLIEEGETSYCRWDWRDCKEEGDRIRTQLAASTERSFAERDHFVDLGRLHDNDLVEVFVAAAAELPTVYVLDNVDQYVDLVEARFTGLLHRLVITFANANSPSRLIITCRPGISYELSSVISFPLSGLSIEETSELIVQRVGINSISNVDMSELQARTKGHPFWLNLIASQLSRVPGTTVAMFLEDLRRGRSEAPDILSSIWKTLPRRERQLLQAMAETVRAEDEFMLERLVGADLNYKNFKRALKMLIQLSLIVVKPEKNAPDLYDLHPLVRHFVRKSFTRVERVSFIEQIIKQYSSILAGLKQALGVDLPFPMLERWSQKAELETEAGLFKQAFVSLHEVSSSLIGSGNIEEFVRVSRKLFEAIRWSNAPAEYERFDSVLADFIECLDDLEQFDDADDLMRRYEETVSTRTARYIGYCYVRAFSSWKRGLFAVAIEWASTGRDLKERTDVDTNFDTSHMLALAQRDGGDPSGALSYFLDGQSIDEILSATLDDQSQFGAPAFGNVGRCLQMLGDHGTALKFLKKSAKLLEEDENSSRLSNQAYARQWIGESLSATGQDELAAAFLADAEAILQTIAPSRARKIREITSSLQTPSQMYGPNVVRRRVREWING